MNPRDMTGPISSAPITEFRMALIVAMHCWPGTSLVEGAFAILDQVNTQHKEPDVSDTSWTLRDEIEAAERRLITMCNQVQAGTQQGGGREFERMVAAQFGGIKAMLMRDDGAK